MNAAPFLKQYLMTAGPTPLPPEVQAASAQPAIYHRGPAFTDLLRRVIKGLKYVSRTSNDVLIFAASGSGAMESAVVNLLSSGEKTLVCSAGKFGERWSELSKTFGADVVDYKIPWGARCDPAVVESKLGQNPGIEVVFATLSETSTGVVHDIEAIARAARKHDCLVVVDAISGLAAVELDTDQWGIDVVVSGSQKALMTPPGLAFVFVSERAVAKAAKTSCGRYYFDWTKVLKAQQKPDPQTPFTPAVSLLAGLDAALNLIEAEGLSKVLRRHQLLAKATRAGVKALGLDLFGDPDFRSSVVTAVALPLTIDGSEIIRRLKAIGITANGGQEQLKGRIVRIAHCGYFGPFDTIVALSGLELTLRQLGYHLQLGSAVGAAEEVFLNAALELDR